MGGNGRPSITELRGLEGWMYGGGSRHYLFSLPWKMESWTRRHYDLKQPEVSELSWKCHMSVCLVNIRQHQHWLHFIMTFLEHGQTSCSATFLFPVHFLLPFQSFPHLTFCCWLFLHEMPVNYWYARLFFHEPLYIESALNYWGKLDKSARVDRRSTSDSLCNISAVFAVSVSHLVIQLELYVGDQRRQTTLWWSVLCVCLMIYTRLQPCRRTSGLTPPESWPD